MVMENIFNLLQIKPERKNDNLLGMLSKKNEILFLAKHLVAYATLSEKCQISEQQKEIKMCLKCYLMATESSRSEFAVINSLYCLLDVTHSFADLLTHCVISFDKLW